MPEILSYTGEQLLFPETLKQVQKEARTLLNNRDVSGSWHAAAHIKEALSQQPAEKIKNVIGEYRKITSNLKAISVPILSKDEVKNIIRNNLPLIDAEYRAYVVAGVRAWIAAQPDEEHEQLMKEFLAEVPAEGEFALQVRQSLSGSMVFRKAPAPHLERAQPAVPAPSLKADEMFDAEESAELLQLAKKAALQGVTRAYAGEVERIAESLYDFSSKQFDKETFLSRAQALIRSRLREVRTTLEIREYLERPFAVGGLGLDAGVIDTALDEIEEEYKKVRVSSSARPTESGEAIEEEPKAPDARSVQAPNEEAVARRPVLPEKTNTDAAPSLDELIAKEKERAGAKPAAQEEASEEPPTEPGTAKESSEMSFGDEIAALVKGEKGTSEPAAHIPPPMPSVAQKRIMRPLPDSTKRRIEDVKQAPPKIQAIGAADELRLITLEDFRKQGGGSSAVKYIQDAINRLEDISIASKLQGIRSFRESELFKQYVAIGRASLSQGKTLAQALDDSAINPSGMSEDEFFALASLNNKLK